MDKVGICHICGRIANNTCTLCGKPVCDNDFDRNTGTCRMHSSGRKMNNIKK
jgi:hypothetical protein